MIAFVADCKKTDLCSVQNSNSNSAHHNYDPFLTGGILSAFVEKFFWTLAKARYVLRRVNTTLLYAVLQR